MFERLFALLLRYIYIYIYILRDIKLVFGQVEMVGSKLLN